MPEQNLLDKILFWSGLQGTSQIMSVPAQVGKGAMLAWGQPTEENPSGFEGMGSLFENAAKGGYRALKGDNITRKEVMDKWGAIPDESVVGNFVDDIFWDLADPLLLSAGSRLAGIKTAEKIMEEMPGIAVRLGKLEKIRTAQFKPTITSGTTAAAKLATPQQVFSKNKILTEFYNSVDELAFVKAEKTNSLQQRTREILKEYNLIDKKEKITNPEKFKSFMYWFEHGHELEEEALAGAQKGMGNFASTTQAIPGLEQPLMTAEKIKLLFPDDVRNASAEMRKIFDDVWTYAKETKPDLGYWRGFYPHYYALGGEDTKYWHEIKNFKFPEIKSLDDYDAWLKRPGMGHFASLEQKRISEDTVGFSKDFLRVADTYIKGSFDSSFKDRLSLLHKDSAKMFLEEARNAPEYLQPKYQQLLDYFYKYEQSVTGKVERQRNAQWKSFFEDHNIPGLKGLERPASQITDYILRSQYMLKLGTSVVRFPLMNLTEPLLKTLPAVGVVNFGKGLTKALTLDKTNMRLAQQLGIYESVDRKVSETLMGNFSKFEKVIATSQRYSEKWNRWLTFNCALEEAGSMGLKGKEKLMAARRNTNTYMTGYEKYMLPISMQNPGLDKTMLQFRSWSSGYVNFLDQMRQRSPKKFAQSLGALAVLAGTGAIPWYNNIRSEALRVGIDLPEVNIIHEISKKIAPNSRGIDISGSLDPFNLPQKTSWLLGPTWGAFAEAILPAEGKLERIAEGISPPMTRMVKYFADKKVFTDADKARYLGERDLIEGLFLSPTLESRRYEILSEMEAALQGKRYDILQNLREEAKKEGIQLDLVSPSGKSGKDITTISSRLHKRRKTWIGKTEEFVRKGIEAIP